MTRTTFNCKQTTTPPTVLLTIKPQPASLKHTQTYCIHTTLATCHDSASSSSSSKDNNSIGSKTNDSTTSTAVFLFVRFSFTTSRHGLKASARNRKFVYRHSRCAHCHFGNYRFCLCRVQITRNRGSNVQGWLNINYDAILDTQWILQDGCKHQKREGISQDPHLIY